MLGRTGMEVVRLGCGGIPIIGVEFEEAVKVVRAAYEAGLNYFDNARAYDNSERKMGTALKDVRDRVFLATKVWARDKRTALKNIETSLSELQTDYVDVMQLHDISTRADFEKVMSKEGALAAAREMQKRGKARFLGISSHNYDNLLRIIDCGEFDTVMFTYNLSSREVEREVLPRAVESGIGTVCMKPVSGGVFFSLSAEEEGKKGSVTPGDALRFVLGERRIQMVLSGFKRLSDVEENVETFKNFKPLSEQERARLMAFGDSLAEGFCRNCTYCLPCPNEIPIPTILQLLDHAERFGYEWPTHRKRYAELEVKADVCDECGQCEESCPFGVKIVARLARAQEQFSKGF